MPDLTRLVFFQTPSPSPRSLAFVLSSSTMVSLVRLVRPIVMYAGHRRTLWTNRSGKGRSRSPPLDRPSSQDTTAYGMKT
jgi:hypothetical protein